VAHALGRASTTLATTHYDYISPQAQPSIPTHPWPSTARRMTRRSDNCRPKGGHAQMGRRRGDDLALRKQAGRVGKRGRHCKIDVERQDEMHASIPCC
jgi:hypothetical protein